MAGAGTIGQRYPVARRLGQGGMSRVYLCWDERLRVWCAIKVMNADAVDDPVLRARFVQEARTLARLGHPHLVRVYDLVDDVACPYMVMEYLEGGSLAARLARGPISLHHAVRVTAELCSALKAAHAEQIIHRDVKPQNLLLDAEGVTKVADFGVARASLEARLTQSNISLGTLAYMPPEQQRDAAKVDHRADLYSAGATLFALATSRRPTQLLTADRDLAINLVPDPVREVVKRATEVSPAKRYASADEMERALRELLPLLPIPPGSPPLVDRAEAPPSAPPRPGDVELEPGELLGTHQPWKGMARPSRPEPVGTGFFGINPSEDSFGPPLARAKASMAATLELPTRWRARRRRSPWAWLSVAAASVLAVAACSALCGGLGLAGSLGTVLAWPGY